MKSKWCWMLCVLVCSGCVSSRDMSRWLIWEKPIEVTEVRRSQQCGTEGDATQLHFFPNLAAYRAWEADRGLALSSAPGAALAEAPYALIEHGQRSSGGYGLAVSRLAARRKEVLILKTTFITPAPGAMTIQALTSPCALVRLPPRPYSGLEVVDQTGKLRAHTD